jgi:hypothetical protein
MSDQKNDPNQPQQLSIELPADIASGVYTNLAIISHMNTEFVLDFVQVLPGTPKAPVRSRVIMSPQNAKRLLLALHENINRYEQVNGEITIPEREVQLPPNVGGPAGIA